MATTPPTTTELLTSARAAYHSLMTGDMPRVIVDQNGDRVEYAAANAGKLYAYIQQLEALLASPCADLSAYAPAQFIF